ncbi:MAG: hypothetical protein IPJ69_06260 [Deltaproteobacteria bacterium]|nr:MAG: hypothetical protein IPJ69_06260 [Deltaproteobacteria bacterium]
MSSIALEKPKTLVSMRLNLKLVDKVKKMLGTKDRTETIEVALEKISEQEKFHQFLKKTAGKLTLAGLDDSGR